MNKHLFILGISFLSTLCAQEIYEAQDLVETKQIFAETESDLCMLPNERIVSKTLLVKVNSKMKLFGKDALKHLYLKTIVYGYQIPKALSHELYDKGWLASNGNIISHDVAAIINSVVEPCSYEIREVTPIKSMIEFSAIPEEFFYCNMLIRNEHNSALIPLVDFQGK